MKKLILLALFTTLLFSNIAKVSALKGTASLEREGAVTSIQKGTELLVQDLIKVDKSSRMQLLFTDKTIITLGSNSNFTVEEFSADENKPNAKFKVSRGAFSAITGRIGKLAPNKFKLKTKTATIGIRGTRFLGLIDEEKEIIACTKGEIYVEGADTTVSVVAGEITSLLQGGNPSVPRELNDNDLNNFNNALGVDPELQKKISNVKINSDLSFNEEEVAEIVNQISSIKNTDARMAGLHSLEDTLNKQIDEGASAHGNRVPISGEPTGDMTWGFYTTNEATTNTIDSAIEATPDDVYRTGTQTDATTIQTLQTKNSVITYSGKNLGYITNSSQYGKIVDNDNNKVDLSVDYLNKSVYGTVSFDAIDPVTGESKFWKLYVGSAGDTVVNPTGYDGLDFTDNFAVDNAQAIDYAKLFFNRYYGESAEQISSYFKYFAKDSQEAYGLFIASKASEVTLTKTEIGSNATDSINSWGYWSQTTAASTQATDIITSKPNGGWIEGSKTTQEEINSFITNNPTANYSGEIFGTVYHPKTESTDLISNGSINLNFDFTASSVKGDLAFESGSETWGVTIDKGVIKGTSFEGTSFSNKTDITINTAHQQLKGDFYGSSVDAVGGNFAFSGENGDIALGAFKGAKQ